jgi:hypothetical protein
VMDWQRARQIADERHARFQRADKERLLAGVVVRQLCAELPNARADLVRIEKDLADALVELDQCAQEAFRNP